MTPPTDRFLQFLRSRGMTPQGPPGPPSANHDVTPVQCRSQPVRL